MDDDYIDYHDAFDDDFSSNDWELSGPDSDN